MDSAINQEVELLTLTGVLTKEEILNRILLSYFPDETPTAEENRELIEIIDSTSSAISEKRKEKHEETDVEKFFKLKEIFKIAEVMLIENISSTPSGIPSAIKKMVAEDKSSISTYTGYCALTLYDITECMDTNYLTITVNTFSNKASLTLMKKVVSILQENEFEVNWDESEDEKICIDPFSWKLF